MSLVFADTGFYVALVNPSDQHHLAAVREAQRLAGVVTTDYILLELANFLRRPNQRTLFLEIERDLRCDDTSIIIPASRELMDRGIELFKNRPDKDWSLTDCISFVAMKDHGVTEALTGDRHFEQAGFVALLADK
jgi:uncharacterized protein